MENYPPCQYCKKEFTFKENVEVQFDMVSISRLKIHTYSAGTQHWLTHAGEFMFHKHCWEEYAGKDYFEDLL